MQYTVRLSSLKGSAVSLVSWSQFAWQAVAVKPPNRELIAKTHKPISKKYWYILLTDPQKWTDRAKPWGSGVSGTWGQRGGQEKKPCYRKFCLEIEENCIKYSSNVNRFTYHLFDDSLANNNPFDFNKIDNITFNTNFKLTKEKNNAILKALPFVTETSKVYIKTENENIYAELSDKKLQNVDSYTALLANEYTGDELDYELILDVELFRLISTLSFKEASININNEYKMLMIKLELENSELTFVSTSYKN